MTNGGFHAIRQHAITRLRCAIISEESVQVNYIVRPGADNDFPDCLRAKQQHVVLTRRKSDSFCVGRRQKRSAEACFFGRVTPLIKCPRFGRPGWHQGRQKTHRWTPLCHNQVWPSAGPRRPLRAPLSPAPHTSAPRFDALVLKRELARRFALPCAHQLPLQFSHFLRWKDGSEPRAKDQRSTNKRQAPSLLTFNVIIFSIY
jgi:hypothetical protein